MPLAKQTLLFSASWSKEVQLSDLNYFKLKFGLTINSKLLMRNFFLGMCKLPENFQFLPRLRLFFVLPVLPNRLARTCQHKNL